MLYKLLRYEYVNVLHSQYPIFRTEQLGMHLLCTMRCTLLLKLTSNLRSQWFTLDTLFFIRNKIKYLNTNFERINEQIARLFPVLRGKYSQLLKNYWGNKIIYNIFEHLTQVKYGILCHCRLSEKWTNPIIMSSFAPHTQRKNIVILYHSFNSIDQCRTILQIQKFNQLKCSNIPFWHYANMCASHKQR